MDLFLKKTEKPVAQGRSDKGNVVAGSELLPWVEKYRPKSIDDVACQGQVISVLKGCLRGQDLPNLLFYGPPGTGKTSSILALTKQMFSPEIHRDRVLELNASDERGIQVIREKVKRFAQFSVADVTPSGKPCPPLKMVILDEADSMTKAAQAALRRTMESESKTTRFCLICNYVTSIIEPITSRCAKFRFMPLTREIQKDRLMYICQAENVQIDPAALDVLIECSEGDLRRAINCLQSASRLKPSESIITASEVSEVCRVVDSELVERFFSIFKKGKHELLEKLVLDVERNAYSAYQLMIQLHDQLVSNEEIDCQAKSRVLYKLATCERRILEGADEALQLMDFGSTAISLLRQ
uniref:AAA domain-containing protein n=1 Tax=Trichuris muris TaxID=70415 RepID=A0A5S6QKE7_TRIMR